MKKRFGVTKRREHAHLFELKNKNGIEVHISDWGATIVRMLVPDKKQRLRDVVLGYDSVEDYEEDFERHGTFFGATIGRNSNRIHGASFKLKQKTIKLDDNNNGNNLHSGLDYYSTRIWEVIEAKEQSLILGLYSSDGDQGFPGNLRITVQFRLLDINALEILYQGISDQDTVFNLTNHSYFNLNGHDNGVILKHMLQMDATHYLETDINSIPTGQILDVVGTPLDFRRAKAVGRDIFAPYGTLIEEGGYNYQFCYRELRTGVQRVAMVRGDESGIRMEVSTDLPGVQVYTGNYLDKSIVGKQDVRYGKHHGICFETQCYTDAVHHEEFPSAIIEKNVIHRTKTIFRFF